MEVSWEYDSQYMESHKNHVPNHQPNNDGYTMLLKMTIEIVDYILLPVKHYDFP